MSEHLEKYFGLSPELQWKITLTLMIIAILWLIQKLIINFLIGNLEDLKQRYKWKKFSLYLTVLFGSIILIRVWFGVFDNFGTFLGLFSAGLAIALKDPIVNIVGWLFILIRQPFKLSDRIEINGIKGDVIDIRIFQFSVIEIGNWVDSDQSTGRIIHLPNGYIFSFPQANYTAGFEYIWNEIPVLVTFESNWKKAKQILTEIINNSAEKLSEQAERQIKETAKKFLIFYSKLTPIVYTSVKDSGVLLTRRYICHARSRRGSEEEIWEKILNRFDENEDIDFAYPTTRFYDNLTEGKQPNK
ncbi:MAG: mechanosensitive ion channel family protein [Melioribacteraceae bacterium]|nr:mechanosensitive ion channel family protein [Melioribacteraceae bacterium]MDD3557257.1 mechanosensitive ion channel family protein [Melioribacteraceae bacterium]